MAGAVTRERLAVPPCRPGDKARFSTRFATRECDHLLQRLESEELVQLAVWKLKGHTNPEIGAKWGRAVCTVERKLRLIRKVLGRDIPV